MYSPFRAPALLIASLFFIALGCSHGETPEVIDSGLDRTMLPDLDRDLRVDQGRPDTRPRDTLSPDIPPCGNGRLDEGEQCDHAILTGQPGACPTLTDCNDQNPCTTDELQGSAIECTARCKRTPLPACCGNGDKEGNEACDDGNKLDSDGCDNDCALPGGHLLITEFAVSPTEAEFIEIYNPSSNTVALDNYYLADRFDYYQITTGALSSGSTDFVARFPEGATIAPGQYLVVARNGLGFKTAYSTVPDFELRDSDPPIPDGGLPDASVGDGGASGATRIPDMRSAFDASASSTIGSQAGLTDSGELLMLFYWDGSADRVQDVDYVVWKGASATAASKNPQICIDGVDADSSATCYLADTPVVDQAALQPPGSGGSLHRCNYLEQDETQAGGNGISGHDETSEPFDETWVRNPTIPANRTPGAGAPLGLCPLP